MRILYVGGFQLAAEPAGAQRVVGVSRSLAEAGHEVTILAADDVDARRELAPGVTAASFRRRPVGRIRSVASAYGLADRLDEFADSDMVVSYGGDGFQTRVIREWARRHGVPRALDSVEWYDRSHMRGGPLGPRALSNEVAMRRTYPKYPSVIAISSLLDAHYTARGCASVRIPPTLDVESVIPRESGDGSRLRLAYAGSPGKKDLVGEIVRGLRAVDPGGDMTQLDIVGIDEVSLTELTGIEGDKRPGIRAHGRVSRAGALELVGRADFVPLLRDDKRYAHAGFPTKVAEAMAAGTPVMANLTSDLGEVILHERTGLVVAHPSADAIADSVVQAIGMTEVERASMRRSARARALEFFDFRTYSSALNAFVVGAVEGR